MRKFMMFIFSLAFIILVIPSIAFFALPKNSISDDHINKDDLESGNYYLILDHKTGEVLKLTPADYIKGVVAAEMPIDFAKEALKAQAVVAHTYALKQIDSQLKDPDDSLKGAYLSTDSKYFQAYFSNEELKERWGDNYEINYNILSDAVDSVINEVLTFDGAPIVAAFHSISSGKTEASETVWGQDLSYLIPVESEGDILSSSYESSVILKPEEIKKAFSNKLSDINFDDNKQNWFEIIKRSDSGTVTLIKVGNKEITGKEVREILSLRSANFSIEYKNDNFTFTTKGYGHGVGLSQYGADYMARQGKTYKEILMHYYTGVTLQKIEK